MTKILNALSDPELVSLLQGGAVGVIPTDTVYGLVCAASNEAAVTRLYSLKDRQQKPGTVIAASIDQLVELGIPLRYTRGVEHLWPNPLSIVIPDVPKLSYLDQGLMSLAIRIPKHEALQQLLLKTGPLLTSSANQPAEPPANNIEEAQKYFGDSVDFYVDAGDLSGHEPSTVIRVIDDAIEVLRAGAVQIDEDTGRIIGQS